MRLRFIIALFLGLFSLTIIAQDAPDFTLTSTEGTTIELYKDYLDQGTTVVIELFFVDCPPCNTFAPYMADLHTAMKNQGVNVEFLTLSIRSGDSNEYINGFKNQYNNDWHFSGYAGGSGDVIQLYIDNFGFYFGTPHTMVISPDKSIEYNVRANSNPVWINRLEAAILDSQANHNLTPPPTPPAMAIISGGISTVDGDGLSGVSLNLSGAKDTTIFSNLGGTFQTGSLIRDTAYTLSLEKNDDHVNGVTTLDIVFISKHILGIDTFTNNYQYIAADVNGSGVVTTFDMVRIRQLILGINDDFGSTKSWYFDPAMVTLPSLNNLAALTFTAVKIGDVNNSADPDGVLAPIDRNKKGNFNLSTNDQLFEAGTTVLVEISSQDLAKIVGFQFTLEFDEQVLQLAEISDYSLEDFNENNFNLSQKSHGLISTSWNASKEEVPGSLFKLKFTALQSGKVSELLSVNSKLTLSEAYTQETEIVGVDLVVDPLNNFSSPSISLYPNPVASDLVYLSLDSPKKAIITLQLWDINGKLTKIYHYEKGEGEQILSLTVNELPAGLYTVQMLNESTILATMRLVKQ